MKPKPAVGLSGATSRRGGFERQDDGYAVNRTAFYGALKSEFESYLLELRNPGNTDLRRRFLKKMNQVVGESY